ncbi:MAG TPA: hypothetical protein VM936_00900 [Pyrinomonadaceae bacterium]|nr:hypothetical protein [Pyrinomonadaceae bacterium]
MNKKWMAFTIALGLLGTTYGVSAQDSKDRRAQVEVVVTQNGPEGLPPKMEMGGDNFVFFATEMSFGGKVVKGAPYSAQAVTESVQTLADGNHIVHKNSAQVYRDSEGRTRRDQTLGAIGPYAAAGDPIQTFFINDPVSGVNYIFDPRSKVARKLPRMEWRWRTEEKPGAGSNAATRDRERVVREHEAETRAFVFTEPAAPPPPGTRVKVRGGGATEDFVGPESLSDGQRVRVEFLGSPKAEAKTEKLEARNVEGVQAEGTRITTTIPAGDIGNEQPIQIVDERWYSPELQIIVMTRHSDPRFGETTYRLTNIQRGEPSASLFQVPPDYAVKEGGPGAGGVRTFRRKAAPPPQEN